MSIPHARTGERGASILAGLVLMAMLGAAVVGIGSSNSYQSASQVAAAVSVIKDTNRPTTVTVGSQTYTVTYACYQVDNSADIKKLEQDCEPGFSYTINEFKGAVTVTPTPTSKTACPAAAKDAKCTDGKTAKKNCSISGIASKCSVTYCVGGKACQNVGDVAAGNPLDLALKRATGIQGAFPGLDDKQLNQIVTSGINDSTQKGLDDALTQAETNAKESAAQAAAKALATEATRKTAFDDLTSCENDPTSFDCSGLAVDAKKAEADAKAAQEKAAEAQAEYKKLADAKVALTSAQRPPGNPDDPTRTTPPCTSNCGPAQQQPPPGQQPPPSQQQTGFSPESFLKGLLGGQQSGQQPPPGNQTPQAPGTCAAGQLICSGSTLYSRNNQCVDTVVQYCQYGCSGTTCAQSPNQGQNCPAAPAQPDPSGCSAGGTWRPTYTGACVNGWQCVPGSGTGQFAAQISCQPQIADVGMSLAISYSCSSGTSVGSGFQTNGAQSGSATVTIANPPNNTNTATYGLTCTNQGQTASAQCTVQVGRPSIVLVANPKAVATSTASRLGWVTSGTQSCVISSPDLPAFTAQNANNTSVNGTATTPPLNSAARFLLHCITVGGGTRQASTTVSIIGVPDTFTDNPSGSVSVSSTADATTIGHGATTTITWTTRNAPSGSALSLWVFDVLLDQSIALIADARAANGAFLWRIPNIDDPCDTNSSIACGSDLVTGRRYLIEAALYTPANAYVGNGAPPQDPIDPTYIDFGFGDPFTMGN